MSVAVESPSSTSLSHSPDYSIGLDDSLDISFEYRVGEDGKVIRISKGSDKSPKSVGNVSGPSPPTPPHTQEFALLSSSSNNESNGLTDGLERRRTSLGRSESMPGDVHIAPSRSLSRTSSGPVSLATPGQSTRSLGQLPSTGGLQGTARRLGGAQRIRKEDAERQRRELDERLRKEAEEAERAEKERARRAIEEKENAQLERHSPPHGNRPIASLPSRQSKYSFPKMGLGLNGLRAGVSAVKANVSKISEVEAFEEDYDQDYGSVITLSINHVLTVSFQVATINNSTRRKVLLRR